MKDQWDRRGLLDIGAIRDCIFMQTADTRDWDREDWERLIESVGTFEQIVRCYCGRCRGITLMDQTPPPECPEMVLN